MSTTSQRNFSGGELAPSHYARTDMLKYQTGLRTQRNAQSMKSGGVQNRPGTVFVGEVKDSDGGEVRLVPFVFNDDQTYVLEFGDQYMRVIRNGDHVRESAKTITALSNDDPAEVGITGHGYSDGDEVLLIVAGMTEVSGRRFLVANATADTFTLQYKDGTDVDSTTFGTFSSGFAEKIYEIVSPFDEEDLATLQWAQSADVMTFVHPDYPVKALTRSGHTSWTFGNQSFNPATSAPSGVGNSGAAGSTTSWVVTTVDLETGEESLQSTATTSSATPSSGSPITVSWSSVTGAGHYNVYRSINGFYGFIGIAGGTSFSDTGTTPDVSISPPVARTPFNATDDRPGAVAYFQTRRLFANTNNNPEGIWTSRTGLFTNFTVSTPSQDDDAITFSLVGKKVSQVLHLVDVGKLISLTSSGPWVIDGSESGILLPTAVNAKQYDTNGANYIRPVVIGGIVLYVQSRGSLVRSIGYELQTDRYRGNDLTTFSPHLFKNKTLLDLDWQEVPHSVVWAPRDDGKLLGLTFVPEHEISGWHRHDSDGDFQSVCVVPEGQRDVPYFLVQRTIDNRTVKYIEYLADREVEEVEDMIFMDCTKTIDGNNPDPDTLTVTISGGTNWDYTETLTLTFNSALFPDDTIEGNGIQVRGSDGTLLRFLIENRSSSSILTGKPDRTVPVSMRSTALSDFATALKTVGGLWHLEGKEVSVLGDGFVAASPNNADYDTVTVTDGEITLNQPYAVIQVGLPYIADLEPLDIDSPDGRTLVDRKKCVSEVTLRLEASRGIWVGPKAPSDDETDPLENMVELKLRNEEGYDDPVALYTDTVKVPILSEWNSHGRFFIRQVDPLPMSVLAIHPSGTY